MTFFKCFDTQRWILLNINTLCKQKSKIHLGKASVEGIVNVYTVIATCQVPWLYMTFLKCFDTQRWILLNINTLCKQKTKIHVGKASVEGIVNVYTVIATCQVPWLYMTFFKCFDTQRWILLNINTLCKQKSKIHLGKASVEGIVNVYTVIATCQVPWLYMTFLKCFDTQRWILLNINTLCKQKTKIHVGKASVEGIVNVYTVIATCQVPWLYMTFFKCFDV
jgi:hypothetical protein